MIKLLRQCAQYAIRFYSPYQRDQIAYDICGFHPQNLPGDILPEIRKRYGTGGLLAAEAILFGWCFMAVLFLDLFSAYLRIYGDILGFLLCAAAFCLCRDLPPRMALKLCYLVFSLVCGGSWLVTAIFMLLFEHLTAFIKTEKR